MRISTLSLRDPDSLLTACSDVGRFHSLRDGYAPVWQTPEWGAFLVRLGQVEDSVFIGVYESDQLAGYSIMEIRGVGLAKRGAYVVG